MARLPMNETHPVEEAIAQRMSIQSNGLSVENLRVERSAILLLRGFANTYFSNPSRPPSFQ
jgi:hypothetical protein